MVGQGLGNALILGLSQKFLALWIELALHDGSDLRVSFQEAIDRVAQHAGEHGLVHLPGHGMEIRGDAARVAGHQIHIRSIGGLQFQRSRGGATALGVAEGGHGGFCSDFRQVQVIGCARHVQRGIALQRAVHVAVLRCSSQTMQVGERHVPSAGECRCHWQCLVLHAVGHELSWGAGIAGALSTRSDG